MLRVLQSGAGEVKVPRDSGPSATFCPAGLPGAGVTAVVFLRDGSNCKAYLRSRDIAAVSLQQ